MVYSITLHILFLLNKLKCTSNKCNTFRPTLLLCWVHLTVSEFTQGNRTYLGTLVLRILKTCLFKDGVAKHLNLHAKGRGSCSPELTVKLFRSPRTFKKRLRQTRHAAYGCMILRCSSINYLGHSFAYSVICSYFRFWEF